MTKKRKMKLIYADGCATDESNDSPKFLSLLRPLPLPLTPRARDSLPLP